MSPGCHAKVSEESTTTSAPSTVDANAARLRLNSPHPIARIDTRSGSVGSGPVGSGPVGSGSVGGVWRVISLVTAGSPLSARRGRVRPGPIFRLLSGASMKMSPDIHVGINPGFTRVRALLGAPIAGLTALSPLVGYSFSVTILILGSRTSFGIVYDPSALPGYGGTFVEAFDTHLGAMDSTRTVAP